VKKAEKTLVFFTRFKAWSQRVSGNIIGEVLIVLSRLEECLIYSPLRLGSIVSILLQGENDMSKDTLKKELKSKKKKRVTS